MPMIIDIADSVVAALNHPPDPTPFGMTFTAQRHYRPVFDLAALKVLHVTVVPRRIEISMWSRSKNVHDISVDVAVQKKVTASDVAEIDGLMGLVEQIADFFRLRRLSSYPDAIWVKTENIPVYEPEHLESKQVFTSVLTLTFRVTR